MGQKVEDEKDRLLERVSPAQPSPNLSCEWEWQQPSVAVQRAMLVALPTAISAWPAAWRFTGNKLLMLLPTVQFVEFAKVVCDRLAAAGHWADYIDPCRRALGWLQHAAAGPMLQICLHAQRHRQLALGGAAQEGGITSGSSYDLCAAPSSTLCPSHSSCSGLPMVHRGTNAVYGEVEALVTLLGYKTQNAGCCKVGLARVGWLQGWKRQAGCTCTVAVGQHWPSDPHACQPRPQIILHPRWGSSVYPASMFAKAPLEAVRQAIDEAVAELRDRL